MNASLSPKNLKDGVKETIVGFLLIGGGLFHLLFNGGDYVAALAVISIGGLALGLKFEK